MPLEHGEFDADGGVCRLLYRLRGIASMWYNYFKADIAT
jgi:hypothetical protein